MSYGIKIWTDFSTVLSQFTRVTDGRMDRQTERILIARPRLHSMQRGKNDVNYFKSQKDHLLKMKTIISSYKL